MKTKSCLLLVILCFFFTAVPEAIGGYVIIRNIPKEEITNFLHNPYGPDKNIVIITNGTEEAKIDFNNYT